MLLERRSALRLILGLAVSTLIVSLWMFAVRPDVARILNQYLPGTHMPDAFDGVNGILPFVVLFIGTTLLLAFRIESKSQRVVLFPLAFGPAIGAVGWWITENYDDPNWFHLLALTTIGMFVSCGVTMLLSVVVRQNA